MARYCPNCGAEVQEGAAFCSNCGRALPQEPPQQDQQGTPPAGTPPADPPPAGTPPPDASPAAQAPPAPQSPQSAVTPPAAPPARRSRTGLYVGCGVAAVLGFLAVLVVVAVIFFFALGSASGGAGDGGDGGDGGGGGEVTTPDEGGGEVTTPDEGGGGGSDSPPPDEGSLDDLVQEQVGDFELQKVEEIPPAREQGVTDAVQMEYTSSDGTPLLHLLGAFDSADSANQLLEDDIDRIVSEEGFEVVDEGVVKSQDGEELGNYVVMQGKVEGTEVLSVLWTNGNLEASALAPGEGALDFYTNSEY